MKPIHSFDSVMDSSMTLIQDYPNLWSCLADLLTPLYLHMDEEIGKDFLTATITNCVKNGGAVEILYKILSENVSFSLLYND